MLGLAIPGGNPESTDIMSQIKQQAMEALHSVRSPNESTYSRSLIPKDRVRDIKVRGTHSNNQNLFFNTEDSAVDGKAIVRVNPANTSKFGHTSHRPAKEYSMVKLNDKELKKIMSDETKAEIQQLKAIPK